MSRILIGLSGAQGAGKSTLLAALSAQGRHVDGFRVSRAVQAALGWETLDRVMDSPDTMIQFQNEVFTQKYQNDSTIAGDGIVLTERTFADICAYTAQWAWRFVDRGELELHSASRFVHEYAQKCAVAQNEIYAGTLLLPLMPHVKFEVDPNRAAEADAEAIFTDIKRFMYLKLPITHKRLVISGITVQDRVAEVQTFLRAFMTLDEQIAELEQQLETATTEFMSAQEQRNPQLKLKENELVELQTTLNALKMRRPV